MRTSRRARQRLAEAAQLEEEGRKRWGAVAFRMSRKRRKRLAKAQVGEEPRLKRFVLQQMRMTRSRKRKMREEAALRQTAKAASISALALLPPMAGEAAGISNAMNDIPAAFESLRNDRDRIRDFKEAQQNAAEAAQALLEAKADLQQAKADKENAASALLEAQQNLEKASLNLQRIAQELANAQLESAQRTREAIAAQQAVADFAPQVWAQEGAVAEAQSRRNNTQAAYERLGRELGHLRTENDGLEERIRQAWESVGYAQNRLNDVMAMVNGAQAAAPERQAEEAQWEAYEKQLESLDAEVDDAEALLDALNSQLDDLQDARMAAEDAEQDARELVRDLTAEQAEAEIDVKESTNDVTEAENWHEEAIRGVATAENNLTETQNWKTKADYDLAHFGEGKGLSTGFEYYTWHGAGLPRGYQLYQPVEFYATEKKWDVSLSTGWLVSDTGLPHGRVSGWTDTQLGLTYKNDHKINDVHYKLTVNAPTGEQNAHQNAMMADNLAAFSSFSEGWQFTPEIEATHRLTERDSLIGRLNYTIRRDYSYRIEYEDTEKGLYDPDVAMEISPRNKFQQEIEYRHIGEQQQFSAKLIHVNSVSAYYRNRYSSGRFEDGEDWTLQLYGSQDIDERNSWQYYLWGNYQAGDVEDIYRYYGGWGLTHQFDKKQRGYVLLNGGGSYGQSYNWRTNTWRGNRHLYALTLGYAYRIDDTSELRAKVERYYIQGSETDSYQGWKMSLMWNQSF
ncbi:hypothetical protein [Selenomonas ruminantium]|uniref:Uncharacterized protein n=1 Tax=Selenomonas ruminantium TaxID=971 RepID=A0A1K1PRK1_SELRU|nr:hypothetical protein [Selenomonas ruminantium]SFW50287.1 hypothetical protein SAMN02910323_2125 [Selenomonas ruminantium]